MSEQIALYVVPINQDMCADVCVFVCVCAYEFVCGWRYEVVFDHELSRRQAHLCMGLPAYGCVC